MRKALFLFLILACISCDSIQEIKAPVIFVANIPEKAVLTLASQYPSAKNIVSNEKIKDQVWEIKFEFNGRFIEQLTDNEGDVLSENEMQGINQSVPYEITTHLITNNPNASLKSISRTYIGDEPLGYEATILDKNETKKINFNNVGNKIPSEIDINNYQIDKIVSSNSLLYLADNEINSSLKSWIKEKSSGEFDLKILYFKSGEQLVSITEKNNASKTNQKIEYLFDNKAKIIRKYEYLNQKDANYSQIASLENYAFSPKDQAFLKNSYLQFGLKTVRFGLEISNLFVFKNETGFKFTVKFQSKNSEPEFYISKKITNSQIPLEIYNYLSVNNLTLVSIKEVYKKSNTADILKTEIEKYMVEIEVPSANGKTKKILVFDSNNKLK